MGKATCEFNAPLEFCGCTNSHIFHVDMFYTYSNYPNKMDLYVAERAEKSTEEYDQINSAMGWRRGSQGIKYGRGQTFSTTTLSMFVEQRDQLPQSWEGFRSIYQILLICEMVDPSISRSTRVACAAAIKNK